MRRKVFFFEKKKQKTFVSAVAEYAALVVLVLGGCSSPEPSYYALQPVVGQSFATGPATVEVRRPGLAGYLDRTDIVLKDQSYRLEVNAQLKWGEPLGDMIGRVLAQDVAQRLPASTVFSEGGAISAEPDMRVEVDVQRFDADTDGTVTLRAQVAIERGRTHRPVTSGGFVATAQPAGTGAGALVGVMSALLGELADKIAVELK